MDTPPLPAGVVRCVSPLFEAVSQMSGDQLDRTFRLLMWMSNTPNATQADVWVRVQRTVGGDRKFAALLVDAIEASRKPRWQAANEVLSPQPAQGGH